MKRSTYSLILMDDVVAAIDRLAAQQGTSRSNLINQILAEHVSCVTPAQQMNSAFRIQEQGSDAMLSILGSVQYKYRPTIRYSVELHREMHGEKVGILKISCRTQSQTLLNAIQQFFLFWVQLEQAYEGIEIQELYQIESNRLTRRLRRHGISSNEALGTAVGKYIQLFHTVLQSYFQGLQQGVPAAILRHALEKQYVALHEKLLPKPYKKQTKRMGNNNENRREFS